jgi:hypothetical protein
MSLVGYNQILIDLVTLTRASIADFLLVGKNLSDRDYNDASMPICDFRVLRSEPVNIGRQDYDVTLTVEFEIAVHSLNSRDDAATIRDGLVSQLQDLARDNSRFGATVDSTILGPVEFATGESVDERNSQGAFVASAIGQLNVRVISQQ